MAKGFGTQQEKQLGYILVLLPEAQAYAAKLSIDNHSEEDFLGITSSLEYAQVWKSQKQAKQAVEMYADFVLEQQEPGEEACVIIKCLKRKKDQLVTEYVETLYLLEFEL
ncbi:MAG: hypothetical protein F6K47_01835 [Symploca sp. SIO2E6]|nr:hypothetical protein [Symploca sp. SIO2E6]